MGVARVVISAGLGLGLGSLVAVPGGVAAEAGLSRYQGAWLMQGPSCMETFSFAGKEASFKKPVDIFAPAFIVADNRLKTPMASCRIKSVKPTGDRQVLTLGCSNAVASNEVKALMSTSPDGSLRRYFNDQDATGTPYQRCSP